MYYISKKIVLLSVFLLLVKTPAYGSVNSPEFQKGFLRGFIAASAAALIVYSLPVIGAIVHTNRQTLHLSTAYKRSARQKAAVEQILQPLGFYEIAADEDNKAVFQNYDGHQIHILYKKNKIKLRFIPRYRHLFATNTLSKAEREKILHNLAQVLLHTAT